MNLKDEIAAITTAQWVVLIMLLVAVNAVILVGLIIAQPFGALPKVLAQAPRMVTRLPFPTFTATSTRQPPPTPYSTRVPTWTPTITPTPVDTPTDVPPTVPPRIFVQSYAPLSTATPTPTATPAYDYTGTARQMSPCENNGNHHIFIYVRDKDGRGLPNVRLRVFWAGGKGGEVFLVTGTKMQDPGLVDFAMFKGSYSVEVLGGSSQVIGPLSPDIPQNETCTKNGNTEANSLYHYSFEVIFTKMR